MKKVIATTLVILLAIAFGFGITSGLVYGICWAFGFDFTWKIAVGIYLVLVMVKAITKSLK